MCGIVAYSGNNDLTLATLVNGLKRLEYRGYDSAGIAIYANNKIAVYKSVGKVINLEKKINHFGEDIGSIGIAHTRWATHGNPTEANAHPHSSSDHKLWLVHNGIIENFQFIKNELIKKNITFESDTDSEVIAKLIGTLYDGDLREAILAAIPQLKGAFSLAVIHEDEPNRLIGVRVSSPLVAGITNEGVILASDVSAIIERTKKVIYLEDGELIDIQNKQFEIVSFSNEVKSKHVTKIDWDVQAANKDGYEHFLIKEIMEQPKVISDTMRGRIILDEADVKFGGLIDVQERLKSIDSVILLGIGTSYYSAKLGEQYFNSLSGVRAQAAMSPEFRYTKNLINKNTWVIALSQSGETADTIAAIEEPKRQGALVTGVVNVVGSTVARITDAGIYNHIGPEISVASTKAFSSQSILLLMQAILLGRQKQLDFLQAKSILDAIISTPKKLQDLLANHSEVNKIADYLSSFNNLFYIGRQLNYPIALEGALKIKEISYVHAEGLSGGELKHGFIALIEPSMPTIAIVPKGILSSKMVSNISEIKARSGMVIAIATEIIKEADHTIVVPDIDNEYVQPIINNVALQLIAYYVAKKKGLDIDQPRNLAKSVTVE